MGFSVESIKDVPKTPEVGGYKEIKSEGSADFQTSKSFWDKLFGAETSSGSPSPMETSKEERLPKGGENIEPPPTRTEKIPENRRSVEPVNAKKLPGFENHLPEILNAVEKDAPANGENSTDTGEQAKVEKNLEQTVDEYVEDLKDKSECPETIPDCPFEASNLEKLPPEEVAKRREEFSEVKSELKKQWEETHGMSWPKYKHDVYSANGKLIRKAGSDYDAHHIQPLGMGGKNEVQNITPLNAEVHYDKQGVHSPDSPYTRLDKMLGGADS